MRREQWFENARLLTPNTLALLQVATEKQGHPKVVHFDSDKQLPRGDFEDMKGPVTICYDRFWAPSIMLWVEDLNDPNHKNEIMMVYLDGMDWKMQYTENSLPIGLAHSYLAKLLQGHAVDLALNVKLKLVDWSNVSSEMYMDSYNNRHADWHEFESLIIKHFDELRG